MTAALVWLSVHALRMLVVYFGSDHTKVVDTIAVAARAYDTVSISSSTQLYASPCCIAEHDGSVPSLPCLFQCLQPHFQCLLPHFHCLLPRFQCLLPPFPMGLPAFNNMGSAHHNQAHFGNAALCLSAYPVQRHTAKAYDAHMME